MSAHDATGPGPARARRDATRVRRSGRRGPATLVGLVTGLGALVVAADLVAVATVGARPVAALGGLTPVDPVRAGSTLATLPGDGLAAAVTAAALAVAGLVLLALAVLPGGRRRRVLAPEGVAPVVADTGVLADALGEVAHRAAGLPADQVSVRLRRRRADVEVRPLNGVPVPVAEVGAALAPAVDRWGLRAGRRAGGRPLPARVVAARRGTVAS